MRQTKQEESLLKMPPRPRLPMLESEKANIYFRQAPCIWPYAIKEYLDYKKDQYEKAKNKNNNE